MVSAEWESVLAAAAKTAAAVQVLDRKAFNDVLSSVINTFVVDPTSSWWWTALRGVVTEQRYGDRDVFEVLRSEIGPEEPVVLLVTNESACPDGAVSGTMASVVDVLRRSIGFEFALVSKEFNWVVFDTHHNALVWSRLRDN